MLEVCFDDSAKGLLRYAGLRNAAGVSLNLAEGDLAAPLAEHDCPRRTILAEWLTFDRYNEQEDLAAEVEDYWRSCLADLEKVRTAPGPLRLWVDQTPHTQCGLRFVADLLQGREVEVRLVLLPSQVQRADGCIVAYRGWGEVEPKDIPGFLRREVVLGCDELARLAAQWQQLRAENAPLRVVEDGAVVSAGLDYYDDLIRREYPEDRCTIAHLIGRVLGQQGVLMRDLFLYRRIRALMDRGELVAISDGNGRAYAAVVRKV